jgi:pyridinium-3,5-biscarboxylic acid mononucleotide synthase
MARRMTGDARSDTLDPVSPFQARLRTLLEAVASGEATAAEAAEALRDLPFANLGFARVDHHRELRQGSCEIVYAPGKTTEQLGAIVRQLLAGNEGPILVTRAGPEQADQVRIEAALFDVPVEERSARGTIAIMRNVPTPSGRVVVLTAGTSDAPVAEEAALTAEVMGAGVELLADAGVAGLHRLAALRGELDAADVIVVVAGMEGALPSVVGGLVARPVIACPTSVGYGASFGGLAALLSMLSSCTPGVVCVNIDDGVGAGYVAALIARRAARGYAGSGLE